MIIDNLAVRAIECKKAMVNCLPTGFSKQKHISEFRRLLSLQPLSEGNIPNKNNADKWNMSFTDLTMTLLKCTDIVLGLVVHYVTLKGCIIQQHHSICYNYSIKEYCSTQCYSISCPLIKFTFPLACNAYYSLVTQTSGQFSQYNKLKYFKRILNWLWHHLVTRSEAALQHIIQVTQKAIKKNLVNHFPSSSSTNLQVLLQVIQFLPLLHE